MSFGTSKVELPLKSDYATQKCQGALYESCLDNSPMYDSIPFNKETCMLELSDVGLTSMYIFDCNALAEIAENLNKENEVKELK